MTTWTDGYVSDIGYAHGYYSELNPLRINLAFLQHGLACPEIENVCSANYVDFIDAVNLTSEQQNFLQEMSDPLLRQSTKDFMVNQQFRKDYWVRGARKLSASEQVAFIRSQRVVLVRNRQDVVLKLLGNLGEATMSEAIYTPILDLMADHVARSIGEIEQKIQSQAISFAQLLEAVLMLSGAGYLNGASGEKHIDQKSDTCRSVNVWLVNRANLGNDLRFLASSVTEGGIEVGRFHQLFLGSIWSGKKSPVDWAQSAWETLNSQGERVKTAIRLIIQKIISTNLQIRRALLRKTLCLRLGHLESCNNL